MERKMEENEGREGIVRKEKRRIIYEVMEDG